MNANASSVALERYEERFAFIGVHARPEWAVVRDQKNPERTAGFSVVRD
jgi:hypothetical protein